MFQERYLERKTIENLLLTAVVMATETFRNGRQIEFSRFYIVNEFGDSQFFFIKSLHYRWFIDRKVLKKFCNE